MRSRSSSSKRKARITWLGVALGHWGIGALGHRGIGALAHWRIGALAHLAHWRIGALAVCALGHSPNPKDHLAARQLSVTTRVHQSEGLPRDLQPPLAHRLRRRLLEMLGVGIGIEMVV